jgi:hypothetical protein
MGHTPRRFVETRCLCLHCGSHVVGPAGFATLAARCSTCGSYEVVPLDDSVERVRSRFEFDAAAVDARNLAERLVG